MKFRLSDLVQREFNYAIVDEVDSILIDEARTPLIISGPTDESTALYYKVDSLVRHFQKDKHYQVDEKTRTVSITETGVAEAEKYLGVSNLYDLAQMDLVHAINQSLKAHYLFKRDVDYMVKDGQVIIVDEFTGRLMPGRRYSDGLHQALEAKEKVKVEQEYQTLASITFQNYFRMYKKLAGMTGTALTEADGIPAHLRARRRRDPDQHAPHPPGKPGRHLPDRGREMERRRRRDHREPTQTGRPLLVGTVSIEKSEHLSTLLRKKSVKHVVLNAKYHEQEAQIIAQAGRIGAVTIATNMAGRGVDILLGGNPEYLARENLQEIRASIRSRRLPSSWRRPWTRSRRRSLRTNTRRSSGSMGLHVIGTERHEARRIDNQLRGRAGRQGDPGSSRFYLSLEDDLMRIFGSDRISGLMARIGMSEGVPIEHNMVSRAIERAQKQVESQNFSIRKHLLEYDDVMNKQREAIYGQRKDILQRQGPQGVLRRASSRPSSTGSWTPPPTRTSTPDEWDRDGLKTAVFAQFGLDIDKLGIDWDAVTHEELREKILAGPRGRPTRTRRSSSARSGCGSSSG